MSSTGPVIPASTTPSKSVAISSSDAADLNALRSIRRISAAIQRGSFTSCTGLASATVLIELGRFFTELFLAFPFKNGFALCMRTIPSFPPFATRFLRHQRRGPFLRSFRECRSVQNMPTPPKEFDFWYAVNNTEVLEVPRNRLETFGTTLINYRLVTELMDSIGAIRIREGRIQAFRPEILTPQSFSESPLEGFENGQANDFIRWLREHESDLVLLKYGFKIRHETVTESVVHDSLDAVVDRIRSDMQSKSDPLSALVVGVDEPWEVCLLKLLVEVVKRSAPGNARDLRSDPDGSGHEIERAFRRASSDRSQLAPLASLLNRTGKFKEYEDRFFALVRSHSG